MFLKWPTALNSFLTDCTFKKQHTVCFKKSSNRTFIRSTRTHSYLYWDSCCSFFCPIFFFFVVLLYTTICFGIMSNDCVFLVFPVNVDLGFVCLFGVPRIVYDLFCPFVFPGLYMICFFLWCSQRYIWFILSFSVPSVICDLFCPLVFPALYVICFVLWCFQRWIWFVLSFG